MRCWPSSFYLYYQKAGIGGGTAAIDGKFELAREVVGENGRII